MYLHLNFSLYDYSIQGSLQLRFADHELIGALFKRIVTWLSRFEYVKKHRVASRTRTPGTVEWILETHWFHRWYSGSSDTLIYSGGRE